MRHVGGLLMVANLLVRNNWVPETNTPGETWTPTEIVVGWLTPGVCVCVYGWLAHSMTINDILSYINLSVDRCIFCSHSNCFPPGKILNIKFNDDNCFFSSPACIFVQFLGMWLHKWETAGCSAAETRWGRKDRSYPTDNDWLCLSIKLLIKVLKCLLMFQQVVLASERFFSLLIME